MGNAVWAHTGAGHGKELLNAGRQKIEPNRADKLSKDL